MTKTRTLDDLTPAEHHFILTLRGYNPGQKTTIIQVGEEEWDIQLQRPDMNLFSHGTGNNFSMAWEDLIERLRGG